MRAAQRLQSAWRFGLAGLALAILSAAPGCRSVARYRLAANEAAYGIIEEKQREALGRTEPMNVESPSETLRRRLLLDQDLPHSGMESLGLRDLPDNDYWDSTRHLSEGAMAEVPRAGADRLTITLEDALQVAARNSREYQAAKEQVFEAALDLDLERGAFRNTFLGALSGTASMDRSGDENVKGAVGSAEATLTRKLKSGAELSGLIALDLAKLLTGDRASSLGALADATISIPLLRGAGPKVAAEPLKQAERNVLYEICGFERFKRTFAVRVASDYLSVLQALDQVNNAEENYRRLVTSARRSRRLADAGKIPEFQFDQTVQDQLRARDRWVAARQAYASRLDQFKVLLGLPTDGQVGLDPGGLGRLREVLQGLSEDTEIADYSGEVPPADAPVELAEPGRGEGGPLEFDPERAVKVALANRLDLRTARGKIYDAQRDVFVAADNLRAELTLVGSAQAGERRTVNSARSGNASLDPGEGYFSALLTLDLPLERTAERNDYRKSLLSLQEAVRDFQELEDGVKLAVRDRLRELLEAREGLRTQARAVELAEKRVRSTVLFLQAGRAEVRDLLEAQSALLTAQNSLTSAAVNYRVAELELQRDLGMLQVNEQGLWQEYSPQEEE